VWGKTQILNLGSSWHHFDVFSIIAFAPAFQPKPNRARFQDGRKDFFTKESILAPSAGDPLPINALGL
jgi:hypothetical protein